MGEFSPRISPVTQAREQFESRAQGAEQRADREPDSDGTSDPARRPRSRKRRRFASWQENFWGEPAATWLLGVLLLGAPQLLGGLMPWAMIATAACSLICLASIGWRAPATTRNVPFLMLAMAVAWLWTVLQALPLPCGLVAALAAESAQKARAAQAALGNVHDVYCSLSQDPGGTRQEIVKGVAIVSAFVASWLFAASGGRRRIFWLVAGSALLMSLVALGHALFEVDRVFGVYTPVALKRTLLLAPLMNPNNLGAFAAIGVPLWIGLTYRDPNPNLRLLGYVAIVVTATASILSLSRGAIGQLLMTSAFMVCVVVLRRNEQPGRPAVGLSRKLGIAAAATLGLGVGGYLVGGQVANEFTSSKLDKLDLIGSALAFAGQHAWVGVGRGAFSSAFVGHEGSTARFVYAEDFPAQWASEWGLPIALLLLASLGVAFVRGVRTSRSLAHLGGFTALFGFALQNLVDFGLELVGVAVVASALLAACVAPASIQATTPDAKLKPERENALGMRVMTGVLLACGVIALAVLAPALPSHQVSRLEAALRAAHEAGDRARFRRNLAVAISLHPSEPVFALLAAAEQIRHMDAKAGPWLNRAMHVAPGWAAPHALAFKWLWQRGSREQALVELRAAATIEPRVDMDDVCRLALANPRWVLTAAPHQAPQRRAFLEAAGYCLIWDNPLSPILDDALLAEFPDSIAALERLAWRLQRLGETDASVAALDRLLKAHPEHRRAFTQRLQILVSAGKLTRAIDEANRALPTLPEAEQSPVLATKALALARMGAADLAQQAVSEVRRRAASSADELAQSYWLEGTIHLELRQPGQALASFREAYRVNNDTNYLREIARLAEAQGDRPQALWAYIQLCQREPAGDGCSKRNALLAPAGAGSKR